MNTDKPYNKIQKILRAIALFSDLSSTQLDALARSACVRQIARGMVIHRPGEPANEVHYILTGHIKRTTDPQGSEARVLDLLYAGQMLGEAEFLASSPRTAYAIAVETTQILSLGGKALSDLLQTVPQLPLRLLTNLAHRQLEMENDTLASRSLEGRFRLLDYFLQQSNGLRANEHETMLRLPSSKRLIAARLGMTPENFSRCLRSLISDHLISVQGRNVHLRNDAIHQFLLDDPHAPPLPLRTTLGRAPLSFPNESTATDLALSHPRPLPAIINQSGRLRMLSQRMAKFWLMIARKISPVRSRKLLKQSIQDFDELLFDLTSQECTTQFRAVIDEILSLWPEYRTLLESPPASESARSFFRLSERVLLATHQLTLSLEQSVDTLENRLINIAGRERMLSQRMAKFFMFLDWQPAGVNPLKCREELRRSMQEFENTLLLLTREIRNQPDIQHQLDVVAMQWQLMREALNPSKNRHSHRHSGIVCSFSEQLLRKMEEAVVLYERKLIA